MGKKSSDNTYTLNEEEAETVRMIYQLYVHEGLGMQRIATRLIELGRKEAAPSMSIQGTVWRRK